MRPLFANAVKCRPDSQGRITVPARLKTYAGIAKDVAIIGVHNRAEIWDAETWNQSDEEMTPERMAQLMEDMDY
jgi:MraZ protein